jgi:hypothetical protein
MGLAAAVAGVGAGLVAGGELFEEIGLAAAVAGTGAELVAVAGVGAGLEKKGEANKDVRRPGGDWKDKPAPIMYETSDQCRDKCLLAPVRLRKKKTV